MAGLSNVRGGAEMRPGGLIPQGNREAVQSLPKGRVNEYGARESRQKVTAPRAFASEPGKEAFLTYITPEEAAMLRADNRGYSPDGTGEAVAPGMRQHYGPGEIPSFDGTGGAGPGGSDSGGDGGPSGGNYGGGDPDDSADTGGAPGGVGGVGGPGNYGGADPDDSADVGGSPGGGAPSSSNADMGGFGGGPSGPTGIGAVDRGLAAMGAALGGKKGSAAQAGAVGMGLGGIGFGAGMAAANGVAQGIGSITGDLTDALGGTPSTDSSVSGPSDSTEPPAGTAEVAAITEDGGVESTPTQPYPESWNEDAFLAANPDVARAVENGTWESGYAFDKAWRKFSGSGYGRDQSRSDLLSTRRGGSIPFRPTFGG